MFDVFVEGAVDTSPDAIRRLADTMATKFGLSADDFVARMVRGRVRVKAKVDRATADAYVRELEKLGARCVVEDSRPSAATPPVGVRVTTPPVGVRATPPSRAELLRTSTPPSGLRATTPPSGLRAATPPSGMRAATPSGGARTTTPPSGLSAAASTPSRPTPPSGLAAASTPSRPTPPSGLAAASPPSRTTPPSGFRSAGPTSRTTPPVGAEIIRPPTQPRAQSVSSGPTESRAQTIATAGVPQTRPPAPLVAATFRTPSSAIPIQSGLAAASSTDTSLGALEDNRPLALASLDGHDAASDSSGSFGPPLELDNGPSGQPGKLITSKPAAKPAAGAAKDRPKDEPLDLFAPPDAGDEALAVDLAPDELEYKARKRMSTPPAATVVSPGRDATPIPDRRSSPAIATVGSSEPAPMHARSKLGPLADVKIRFAAGVVAAILVGFLPATIVASIRERSAYRAIDDSYVEASMDAAPPADLDGVFLGKKKSAREEIAFTSLLIWAVGGGAVAYVWFRRVPWDRWA